MVIQQFSFIFFFCGNYGKITTASFLWFSIIIMKFEKDISKYFALNKSTAAHLK